MVTHPDLELYVTWTSLENALKGLRDALDSAMNNQRSFEPAGFEQRGLEPREHVDIDQKFTQTVRKQTKYLQCWNCNKILQLM